MTKHPLDSIVPPHRHADEAVERVQRYRDEATDGGATAPTTEGWIGVA